MSEFCSFRWQAPRLDVQDSVPVEHVCGRERQHPGTHFCVCGLVYIVRL
jgi:hypothetical protein